MLLITPTVIFEDLSEVMFSNNQADKGGLSMSHVNLLLPLAETPLLTIMVMKHLMVEHYMYTSYLISHFKETLQ